MLIILVIIIHVNLNLHEIMLTFDNRRMALHPRKQTLKLIIFGLMMQHAIIEEVSLQVLLVEHSHHLPAQVLIDLLEVVLLKGLYALVNPTHQLLLVLVEGLVNFAFQLSKEHLNRLGKGHITSKRMKITLSWGE